MTVSSLAGPATQAVSALDAAARARPERSATAPGRVAAPAAASAGFSQVGQLLSTLEGLAESDPQTFKATTARLSTMLASAAQATDGADADWLSSMAKRFETASTTGTLPPVVSQPMAAPAYTATGLPTPIPTFRPKLPAAWTEIFNA